STQMLETSLASKVDTVSKKSGGILEKIEAIKTRISKKSKTEVDDSILITQEEIDKLYADAAKRRNENEETLQINETPVTDNTSNNVNSIVDSATKPLIAKFLSKYFNNDFANNLRSIDFGKYIFRSLNPEADMPQAAELKNEIINLLNKDSFTDDKLVGLIIDKTNNDAGTVSFDMVADMVDSDAYNKFGQNNAKDRAKKNKFEKWIYKKSVLSKLDDEVLVTLHEESLKKVIDAIVPEEKKEDFLEKINEQVDSFKTFSDEVSARRRREGDDDFQNKLAEITAGAGHGYVMSPKKQLNELYGLIYNDKDADAKKEILYTAWASAKNKEDKDVVLSSEVANENLTLQALTITGAIPVNAEKKPFQINEFPVKSKEFNPVTDVITTFGMSVTGAGVFSALRAIPGIGEFLAPFMAVANVGRVAWSTYKKEKAKASKNFDLKSSDVKKIARKVAGAMVLKSLPYLGTSLTYAVLGSKARAVSAVWMFVKTWYDDVNRSAAEQLRKENESAPKKKGFFKDLKNNLRSISKKDQTTALAHAAAKAGAVFLGGQIGAWGGAKVGEMFEDDSTIDVGDKLRNFGDKFKGIFNRQSESPVVSNDEQVLSDSKDLMDTYENNRSYEDIQKIYNQRYQGDMIKNLSAESLAELDAMDEIELTDAARSTADVNNHRQYIDGGKQDWYTHAEQAKVVDLLEHAGVEDPMGVLRKLGSAARFEAAGECEGAGYQDALKNLGNGTLTDTDVDAIQKALINIDETGDLIKPNAGASVDTSGIESATSENPSTSGATTEPSASQSQAQPQTQTHVETETKLSALNMNMKDVSVGNSVSVKNNDVAVVPPHIDNASIGNGKIVDLDDIDITYVPSNSIGNNKIDEGTINTGFLPKDKAYDRGV
ncbi:MAG: hypothetical protein IKT33_00805, partial [Clostridia bacterium]|nr:hypothetical protein [Clostridia bacterium]